jgi:hypothetical protein
VRDGRNRTGRRITSNMRSVFNPEHGDNITFKKAVNLYISRQ